MTTLHPQAPTDELKRAKRALVALHVPWSKDAIRAAELLSEVRPRLADLKVYFALLNEEDPRTRDWVRLLEISGLSAESPRGAGSFIWLDQGQLVDYELNATLVSADQLVARTHRWWVRTH